MDSWQASPLRGVTLTTARGNPCTITVCAGSILEYTGDAFVNAANEGCVGGFGVDEMVNRSAGIELRKARQAFGGCPTGEAKISRSFDHTRVSHIIHAVGPVFRINRIKDGIKPPSEAVTAAESAAADAFYAERDPLLAAAYAASMALAQRTEGIRRVGFCLLSASVFRGEKPLADVIEIGLRSVVSCVTAHPPLADASDVDDEVTEICFVAYTPEEQAAACVAADRVFGSDPAAEVAAPSPAAFCPLLPSTLCAGEPMYYLSKLQEPRCRALPLLKVYAPFLPGWVPQRIVAEALGHGQRAIDAALRRSGAASYVWATEFENVHRVWSFKEPRVKLAAAPPGKGKSTVHACSERAYHAQKPRPYSDDAWFPMRDDAMRAALRGKFCTRKSRSTALRALLLSTWPHPLLAIKDDAYWGVGYDGVGENRLAELLQELREELRRDG